MCFYYSLDSTLSSNQALIILMLHFTWFIVFLLLLLRYFFFVFYFQQYDVPGYRFLWFILLWICAIFWLCRLFFHYIWEFSYYFPKCFFSIPFSVSPLLLISNYAYISILDVIPHVFETLLIFLQSFVCSSNLFLFMFYFMIFFLPHPICYWDALLHFSFYCQPQFPFVK